MISASHNPPSDNAIKVFWSTGGQINAPHDAELVERIGHVGKLGRMPFAEALATRRQYAIAKPKWTAGIARSCCGKGITGRATLKILYSPLHGVGATSVLPVLTAAGFRDVELFAPHATPDGDFPNVPEHVANPENPQVFDALIARAEQTGADLVLASDPDADRIGAAARLTRGGLGERLNGNQIGVVVGRLPAATSPRSGPTHAGRLRRNDDRLHRHAPPHRRRLRRAHGRRSLHRLQMDRRKDRRARARSITCSVSKRRTVTWPAITFATKTAPSRRCCSRNSRPLCASEGRTLHEQLERLYLRVGWHLEKTVPLTMPGADGMMRMQEIMRRFRAETPTSLGGLRVEEVRDYATCTDRAPSRLARVSNSKEATGRRCARRARSRRSSSICLRWSRRSARRTSRRPNELLKSGWRGWRPTSYDLPGRVAYLLPPTPLPQGARGGKPALLRSSMSSAAAGRGGSRCRGPWRLLRLGASDDRRRGREPA